MVNITRDNKYLCANMKVFSFILALGLRDMTDFVSVTLVNEGVVVKMYQNLRPTRTCIWRGNNFSVKD